MTFHPENRMPKKGLPVYDSSGEQRNLSDPRYRKKDGLENTTKPQVSSTSDMFSTVDGALSRAEQLGCNGYHEVTYKGEQVFLPCSTENYYLKRMEQFESAINFTYIGSHRVLSWDQPFKNVKKFNGWNIAAGLISNGNDVILDSNDISIEFRYSVDGESWSLWTNVGTALTGFSESETSNNSALLFEIDLDPANDFYPEFRFTSALVNDDGSIVYQANEPIDPNVTIIDLELDLEYDTDNIGDNVIITSPNIRCGDEKSNRPVIFNNDAFTFDPYAINQGVNLYKDLSIMVNKMFGFDVNYYSVQPQARGKDVLLKEYTLFNVVAEECMKVVIPDNQFPDNKVNFDPFGVTFEEPFEIHIDKQYFEDIFGKNSQPRKRDIIFFPITNRIYEINSTYLFKDFMYSPVYFKIELKKYEPKSNTYFKDPAHKEELEAIGMSSEELFGDAIEKDELKNIKPAQYVTTSQRRSEDPNRSYIYNDLSIIGFDLNNNWTIVFNNYYDLASSFIDNSEFEYAPNRYREAIRYKASPILSEGEEIAFTNWFSLRNYYGYSRMAKTASIPLTVRLESKANGKILYSTHPYAHKLNVNSGFSGNPDGYVAIKGDANHTGAFEVLDIVDEYRFTVKDYGREEAADLTGWRMQKAQARNMIHGMYYFDEETQLGIHMDILHSGSIEPDMTNFIEAGSVSIKIKDLNTELDINSKLQFVPNIDSWYGMVVNLSNKYKQLSINIWEMSYDPTNPQAQTSELRKVHEYVRSLDTEILFDAPEIINDDNNSPYYGTDDNAYKIFTSPLYLSNIRIFKNMIDIDDQSTILNQNVVRDEQLAHIIDNAKPPLELRKFARNR